jgi:hypothetical protein
VFFYGFFMENLGIELDLESARNEVRRTKAKCRSSDSMAKFTKAALTTTAVCLSYGAAKFLFDVDINDISYLPPNNVIAFTGVVSGLVGVIGLARRPQDRIKRERMANAAKENLNELMIELAKTEYQDNIAYVSRMENRKRRGYQ